VISPVAANFSIVWMSPESIDRTVIAASCSNCEPGFTKGPASAAATAAAAAGRVEWQISQGETYRRADNLLLLLLLRVKVLLRCRAPLVKDILMDRGWSWWCSGEASAKQCVCWCCTMQQA
jgi:hypothetical protein